MHRQAVATPSADRPGTRRIYTTLILLAGALILSGCSTSQGAQAGDVSTVDGEQVDTASADKNDGAAGETLPDFAPASGTPTISYMAWGADGTLRLGFADGKWARVDPATNQAQIEPVTKDAHAVVSISKNAQLAFVDSTPPTIIRLRDHQIVLRLNKVKKMRLGGFFTNGEGLFVGDETGTLHVWTNTEKQLEQAATHDLKHMLKRQAPNFSAQIAPLSGEVLLTPADDLIMSTRDGKVLSWNFHAPEAIDAVVQLPAAGRAFGASTQYMAATTVDGALRVINRDRSVFVPWSLKARGDVVAASPALGDGFVVAAPSDTRPTLAMRAFEDGAYRWKSAMPAGEVCGLALSADAKYVALCVDSGIILVDPSTGKARAALRRSDDTFEWQESPTQ